MLDGDFEKWCREHDADPFDVKLRERFETFDWYHGAARWDFPGNGQHVMPTKEHYVQPANRI